MAIKNTDAFLWGHLGEWGACACPYLEQKKIWKCFSLAQKKQMFHQVCALQFCEENITKFLSGS